METRGARSYGNYVDESSVLAELIALSSAEEGTASHQFILDYLRRNNQEIIKAVRAELKKFIVGVAANSAYMSDGLRWSDLCLLASPKTKIHVGLIQESASKNPCVFTLPGDMIIMNLGNKPLRLELHQIPEKCNLDEFDSSFKLEDKQMHVLDTGDAININCSQSVPDFTVSDEALVLKILFDLRNQQGWVYDKATKSPIFANSTFNEVSRLQAAARLLTLWNFDGDDRSKSISALEKLTEHRAHFVRWTAYQSLFRLAPERGQELLDKATGDAHPHVRAAARSSMHRIYGGKTQA